MWCGNMYFRFSFLLVMLLCSSLSYANHHYYPDEHSSFQVYTQLHINKFIVGFRSHTVVTESFYLNTELLFFDLTKPALTAGIQLNDVGYDRKVLGSSGYQNRLFVDIYQ